MFADKQTKVDVVLSTKYRHDLHILWKNLYRTKYLKDKLCCVCGPCGVLIYFFIWKAKSIVSYIAGERVFILWRYKYEYTTIVGMSNFLKC